MEAEIYEIQSWRREERGRLKSADGSHATCLEPEVWAGSFPAEPSSLHVAVGEKCAFRGGAGGRVKKGLLF